MSTLVEQARSYLEAGGFRTRRVETGFLYLERPRDSGEIERQLVWCDDETGIPSSNLTRAQRAAREAKEAALLRCFEREMRAAPGAKGYYLVGRKLGLSQEFVSAATRVLGELGGIRAPVEFFDTSYRIDRPEARRARSALGDVLARAEKVARIPQSFSLREAAGAKEQARGDVVDYLHKVLTEPSPKAQVHMIDGPAGSGKSIAFDALVAEMHRGFMVAKSARQEAARPIVFLPGHLRDRRVGYVDDVLMAVAETDVAELTSPEQMKWLLKSGRSVWMFDGLDEFYGGDSNFLSFVEQALAWPDSRAQFVICMRDSLLSSSPVVQNFIERRLSAGNGLKICDLAPWTPEACEELAWLELENGTKRGKRSARVDQFVSLLRTSKETAALAQLPFYCRALLALFKHDSSLPQNDLFVLETLVECMIDREHGKRIFRWQDFVDFAALRSVVEDEVAKSRVEVPRGQDLDTLIGRMLDEEGRDLLFDLIAGYAHRIQRMRSSDPSDNGITSDLVEASLAVGDRGSDTGRRLRAALVRFAFFGAGRKAGSVDFSHEILAEYLAARYAHTMLKRTVARIDAANQSGSQRNLVDLELALRDAVGIAPVQPGSVFHRYFANELTKDPKLKTLLQALFDQSKFGGQNAKNFLQLLIEGSAQEANHWASPTPKRRFGLAALFGASSARQ
ncbi:MAG TPA: hypothetical protein VK934_01555 [Fimbriimonas sp.]|nr:hypothetical protein [Fimbriimonas sp.]